MAKESERISPERIVKVVIDEVIDQLAETGVTADEMDGVSIFTGVALQRNGREQLYIIGTSSDDINQTELISKFIARMIAAKDIDVNDLIAASKKVVIDEEDSSSRAETRVVQIKNDEIQTVSSAQLREPQGKDEEIEEVKPTIKDKPSSIMDKLRKLGKL